VSKQIAGKRPPFAFAPRLVVWRQIRRNLLYGVETRALNQAMKRNQHRFPADFMFDLARAEILRISQTVTSLRRLKFSKQVRAFTEHGALMAAMVLSSPRAVAILKRLAEIDKTLLTHDAALRDIYHKLRPLLAPLPDPPRQEIGFHIKEEAAPYRVKKHLSPGER
jgi:hypothetical protein